MEVLVRYRSTRRTTPIVDTEVNDVQASQVEYDHLLSFPKYSPATILLTLYERESMLVMYTSPKPPGSIFWVLLEELTYRLIHEVTSLGW
jgi:hypothetical protein